MTPALHDALAAGAIVVTPNRRLARHLHREFDERLRADGRRAWPTATVLPYAAWLETLWEQWAEARAPQAPARLLSSAQRACLWQRVVIDSQAALLDAPGAARSAAEAWTLLHGWGAGGESWRAWRRDGADPDDAATFAAWAEAYQRQLRHADAIDIAQLPDFLATHATALDTVALHFVFVGFLELSPQQERLIAALVSAGSACYRLEAHANRASAAQRTTAATPSDEWRTALSWARAQAHARPQARIGIVIGDLAQHRKEIVALADEVLCPERLLAGSGSAHKPYEVSLGEPLADVPLVRCALDLLALASAELPAQDACALLRSPYLAGAATAWVDRARVERDWIEEGRRNATLVDAIEALTHRDAKLAARWREGRVALRAGASATPRAWTDDWRSWLVAAGWLEDVALDSAEYQARSAWDALLAEFACLGVVTPMLSRGAAVSMLRALLQERVFQPEGGAAPIQLLGVLEGSGLDFDALWVTGMTADSWPAAPSPNPLLPRPWQRVRQVPHASAEWELERARQLTGRFAIAAPQVVFSSAARVDDHLQSPSALLLDYPHLAATVPDPGWTAVIADSAKLHPITDDRAPPLVSGSHAPGGSRIVGAQSDCPFRAVARHRLDAEPWPALSEGLSPAERGKLIHATMAAFWADLRDRAALASLDENAIRARIDAAIAQARGELPQARWRNLPAAVHTIEAQRIASLVVPWLALERARPPFAVIGIETKTRIELAGLEFDLRLDRIDALDNGGEAIIDYKTGLAEPLSQWFAERPSATQLGLYALARRAGAEAQTIRALAYAQLRPDAIKVRGIGADASAWPGLTDASKVDGFADWNAIEAWWSDHLGALAGEIAAGWAAVTPRERPSPCRNCGLQALCRIESVIRADDEVDADE